jgi:hypothetical protein
MQFSTFQGQAFELQNTKIIYFSMQKRSLEPRTLGMHIQLLLQNTTQKQILAYKNQNSFIFTRKSDGHPHKLQNTTQKDIFGLQKPKISHFYDKNLTGHPVQLKNTTQKAIFGLQKPKISHFYDKNQTGHPH